MDAATVNRLAAAGSRPTPLLTAATAAAALSRCDAHCRGSCIDWKDLSDKMRRMMDFAARDCSEKDYGDSFMVHFGNVHSHPGKRQCTHDVIMQWWCNHLMPSEEARGRTPSSDPRRHEDLLREAFPRHHLEIEKLPYRWEVTISTPREPDEPPRKKTKVSPRPAAVNSDLDRDDFRDLFSVSTCSIIQ